VSKKNKSGDPRKRSIKNYKEGKLLREEIINRMENDTLCDIYDSMERKTMTLIEYLVRFCENSECINKDIVKREYIDLLNQKDDFWFQHIINWLRRQEFTNIYTGINFKTNDVCKNTSDILNLMLLTHHDSDLIELFWKCPDVRKQFDI
jgi:hypothetical protein